MQYLPNNFTVKAPGADVGASAEVIMGKIGDPCESTGDKKHRLLVVEDDELVRVTLELMLRPHYDVCSVDSISAAQPILQENAVSPETDKFAVVLCDFTLGDGTASDLYDWMKQEVPSFTHRFALMTGGMSGLGDHSVSFSESAPRLEKPFTTQHVISVVTECLARRDAA